MNSRNFFAELKRRNVIRATILYVGAVWALAQGISQLGPSVGAPEWATRWFLVAAVIGFPFALVLSWFYEFTPEGLKRESEIDPGESISQKSVAVLPFENRSEEKQNEYFADGVQDEILTYLANIADLKVISRTSVLHYKSGVARNLREVAQQLGVANVVEGSVQRSGNRVRVNVQLVDARNDAHLWAQTYDRDLADVFAIQSEIAKAIAGQLQAKLSPNEKKAVEQPPTTDLAAFDLYSRAKSLLLTARFSATNGKLFRRAEAAQCDIHSAVTVEAEQRKLAAIM